MSTSLSANCGVTRALEGGGADAVRLELVPCQMCAFRWKSAGDAGLMSATHSDQRRPSRSNRCRRGA
jgi:hypothetical protein